MPENKSSEELKVVRIPEILAVLPLAGTFVFPKMLFPLEIAGEPSITLIDEAMAGDRVIGLIMLKAASTREWKSCITGRRITTPSVRVPSSSGWRRAADNKAQLLLQGISRFRILEFIEGKPYLQVRVENLEEEKETKDIEVEALMANLIGLFETDREALSLPSSGVRLDGQIDHLTRGPGRLSSRR